MYFCRGWRQTVIGSVVVIVGLEGWEGNMDVLTIAYGDAIRILSNLGGE